MTIILIISLISLIIFCFHESIKIDNYINTIKKFKLNSINNNKKIIKNNNIQNNINKNKNNKNKNKNKNNSKIKNQKSKKNNKKNNLYSSERKLINIQENKNKNNNNKNNNKNKNKNKSLVAPPKIKSVSSNRKNKSNISKNNENIISSKLKLKNKNMKNNGANINIVRINNFNFENYVKKKSPKKSKNAKIIKFDNKVTSNMQNYYQSSYEQFNLKTNLKDNIDKTIKKVNKENLNDEELNTLEYEIAIEIDKRTYLKYYWSLLKKKHLILFTFFRTKDFNLITIKICLFLLSFSLYFTINGFFFSDETMHKIHEEKGAFNFIYQIPQILYSTIASSIINIILKQLSLSENNILALKKEDNIKKIVNYSKSIKRCLTIKFVFFFILNFIFLLFFWYFISCFCAVYKNTQIILIKDTLISFGISMLYPFGLNLLPGIFRIPALRAKKKDKKCLYKTSGFIALI